MRPENNDESENDSDENETENNEDAVRHHAEDNEDNEDDSMSDENVDNDVFTQKDKLAWLGLRFNFESSSFEQISGRLGGGNHWAVGEPNLTRKADEKFLCAAADYANANKTEWKMVSCNLTLPVKKSFKKYFFEILVFLHLGRTREFCITQHRFLRTSCVDSACPRQKCFFSNSSNKSERASAHPFLAGN